MVISFVSFLLEVDLGCWRAMGEDDDDGSMRVDRTSKGRWLGVEEVSS